MLAGGWQGKPALKKAFKKMAHPSRARYKGLASERGRNP